MPPVHEAIAIIPARLGSTRFPAKALADDTGKPLVVHVCEQAARAKLVRRVVVATDAHQILDAVNAHGFEGVMTSVEHPNGTSRLAQACEILELPDDQLVVNVQGDEPEIEPAIIDAVAEATMSLRALGAGTVVCPISQPADFTDPNIVKAVLGVGNGGMHRAVYFSRAPVPYPRNPGSQPAYRHVGIYGYRVEAIRHYLNLAESTLETTESLEQLRWLAHGHPIIASVADAAHTGIDTPEQYRAFVERHMQKNTQN